MRLTTIAILFAAGTAGAAAEGGTLVYRVDTAALTRALHRSSIDDVRDIVGDGPELTAVDDGMLVRPQPGDVGRVDALLAEAGADTYGFAPADAAKMKAAGVWEAVARRMDELGVPPTAGYRYERRGDGFVVRAASLFMDPTLADWAPTYLGRRTERVVGLNSVEPAAEDGRYIVRSELDVGAVRRALDTHAELSINLVVQEPGSGVVMVPADPAAMGGEAPPLLTRREPIVTGADVLVAEPSFDSLAGEPTVLIVLTDAGAQKLGAATETSVGQPLAIVLDGVAISAPVVREPVRHGIVQITGALTEDVTEDLAVRLQSAAAPGAIVRVEE